ncbi:S-adenosyl-L-methionine-dependent methyltransferase [Dichotomocladium elegans]|nr:S-adenosyl-L-methionine-dependent methyltransferase [Dichotomocladium elegans]
MAKARPSSRLFSWFSQWTHWSNNTNSSSTSSSSTTTTTNKNDKDHSPLTQYHASISAPGNSSSAILPSEPISVPAKDRPSISLSMAGTMDDSICSSSSFASYSLGHLPVLSDFCKANDNLLSTRSGHSFPDKRPSLALSLQDHHPHPHRPSSVFSLPSPSSTRANRFDGARPLRQSILLPSARWQRASPPYKSDGWPRTDRMIIRQELLRLALDGLYFSPVRLTDPSKHIRVLHIGCGNGAWCMDMARKYKHAFVLGIDERDVLDRRNSMPTNFRFMCAQEDILADLKRLPDNQFDFIYGRFLIFSFRPDQYRDIVQECWRLCKPTGYMEMMELDMQIYGNIQVGPMTQMTNMQVIYLMERHSLDPYFARHLQDIFFFHQLVEQMQQHHGDAYHASHTSLPLGLWGGRIGVMFRDDLHDLIEVIHRYDDVYNPWASHELSATLDRLDEEFELQRAFMNLHHVYTQKL